MKPAKSGTNTMTHDGKWWENMMKHYRKQMKTMTACGRHDETNDEMWLKHAISKQEQNDENWWETWWPLMRTNSETVTTWYKLRACDKNDIKTHDKLIKTEEVRMKYGKNDITKTSQHNDRQYMRKWWTYTVKQCKKQSQNAENWWKWWSMIRTIQKQWQHNETWWNKWNIMDTLQK